jgi:hypothetical protein
VRGFRKPPLRSLNRLTIGVGGKHPSADDVFAPAFHAGRSDRHRAESANEARRNARTPSHEQEQVARISFHHYPCNPRNPWFDSFGCGSLFNVFSALQSSNLLASREDLQEHSKIQSLYFCPPFFCLNSAGSETGKKMEGQKDRDRELIQAKGSGQETQAARWAHAGPLTPAAAETGRSRVCAFFLETQCGRAKPMTK